MAEIPEERKLELLAEKDVDELTEDEVSKMMDYETEMWRKNGMATENIGINLFTANVQIITLMRLLIEKEIFTKEELDITFTRETIKAMKEIRTQVQGELLKAQIMQGVRNGINPRGII